MRFTTLRFIDKDNVNEYIIHYDGEKVMSNNIALKPRLPQSEINIKEAYEKPCNDFTHFLHYYDMPEAHEFIVEVLIDMIVRRLVLGLAISSLYIINYEGSGSIAHGSNLYCLPYTGSGMMEYDFEKAINPLNKSI